MNQPSGKVRAVHRRSGELPRAVIFDFDGVILESADIKTEAFLELFAAYPEHREAILRHHLENLGVSRYRKFEWIYSELLGRPLDDEQSRRLGDAFSEIVMEKVLACPFVPGALELLEALHPQSLLFVASGTPQDELELIVERRGLVCYFTEVWGSPRKKREIVRSILARHGLDRRETLFVGDGISDYQTATEVGVHFFARETDGMAAQWRELGTPCAPDLKGARSFFESLQISFIC